MSAVTTELLLAPEPGDDMVIVSKKGLDELARQAEQAKELAKEVERLVRRRCRTTNG